jgi:glycerol-3-phosphate dehydrogenase
MAQADPDLSRRLTDGHPATRAEALHVIRREMAVTLSDLLKHRLHLFHEVPGQAVGVAAELVDFAGRELAWDAPRKARELASYLDDASRMMAFRPALAGGVNETVPS